MQESLQVLADNAARGDSTPNFATLNTIITDVKSDYDTLADATIHAKDTFEAQKKALEVEAKKKGDTTQSQAKKIEDLLKSVTTELKGFDGKVDSKIKEMTATFDEKAQAMDNRQDTLVESITNRFKTILDNQPQPTVPTPVIDTAAIIDGVTTAIKQEILKKTDAFIQEYKVMFENALKNFKGETVANSLRSSVEGAVANIVTGAVATAVEKLGSGLGVQIAKNISTENIINKLAQALGSNVHIDYNKVANPVIAAVKEKLANDLAAKLGPQLSNQDFARLLAQNTALDMEDLSTKIASQLTIAPPATPPFPALTSSQLKAIGAAVVATVNVDDLSVKLAPRITIPPATVPAWTQGQLKEIGNSVNAIINTDDLSTKIASNISIPALHMRAFTETELETIGQAVNTGNVSVNMSPPVIDLVILGQQLASSFDHAAFIAQMSTGDSTSGGWNRGGPLLLKRFTNSLVEALQVQNDIHGPPTLVQLTAKAISDEVIKSTNASDIATKLVDPLTESLVSRVTATLDSTAIADAMLSATGVDTNLTLEQRIIAAFSPDTLAQRLAESQLTDKDGNVNSLAENIAFELLQLRSGFGRSFAESILDSMRDAMVNNIPSLSLALLTQTYGPAATTLASTIASLVSSSINSSVVSLTGGITAKIDAAVSKKSVETAVATAVTKSLDKTLPTALAGLSATDIGQQISIALVAYEKNGKSFIESLGAAVMHDLNTTWQNDQGQSFSTAIGSSVSIPTPSYDIDDLSARLVTSLNTVQLDDGRSFVQKVGYILTQNVSANAVASSILTDDIPTTGKNLVMTLVDLLAPKIAIEVVRRLRAGGSSGSFGGPRNDDDDDDDDNQGDDNARGAPSAQNPMGSFRSPAAATPRTGIQPPPQDTRRPSRTSSRRGGSVSMTPDTPGEGSSSGFVFPLALGLGRGRGRGRGGRGGSGGYGAPSDRESSAESRGRTRNAPDPLDSPRIPKTPRASTEDTNAAANYKDGLQAYPFNASQPGNFRKIQLPVGQAAPFSSCLDDESIKHIAATSLKVRDAHAKSVRDGNEKQCIMAKVVGRKGRKDDTSRQYPNNNFDEPCGFCREKRKQCFDFINDSPIVLRYAHDDRADTLIERLKTDEPQFTLIDVTPAALEESEVD